MSHSVIRIIAAALAFWAALTSAQDLYCTSPSKFYISRVIHNWIGAAEYCHLLGMRMAVIDTEAKQNEVVRLVEHSLIFNVTKTDLWIGASDLAEEGTFVWLETGIEISKGYTNWARTQPDNLGSVEHCLHMWYEPAKNLTWHWNDWDCERKLVVVCENVQEAAWYHK
ncbi:perlucin-like [Aedes albopictus]|uniref:C-type lectin domain-containing protein n=1 Tax=Aedes albopictus TaxID=7160 RepID=A0ABM1YNH9_AEDAL|nr:perlucin-like [Aedes albopictus]XP_029716165.1 perlucin-like [Aedes albopictus]XP_029716166.1 perlucin-like [Aedes albopictus]XP_029716419.1 perlucin-like [Aedes albopictus]